MLTDRTKRHLTTALVSKALADEAEAVLDTPATLSTELSRNLEIALADQKAFAEIKTAMETGLASLSKRSSDALSIALADKTASLEMFAQE